MHMGKSGHFVVVEGAFHTLDPLIQISINVLSERTYTPFNKEILHILSI